MLNLTYPGVYIEELSSGVHTITGVATSITAFIGYAPKGPTDRALLVQSWPEFERQFDGLIALDGASRAYLGYAVNQFFANGGQQAYIVRLAPSNSATASWAKVGGALDLFASSPGAWANDLQIRIKTQSANANRFTLEVIDGSNGNTLESFANLSVTSTDPQYVVTVIGTDSEYVTFVDPAQLTTAPTAPSASPSNTTVPAPVQDPAQTSSTGGTLAEATYFYMVSARYGNVEGGPSGEQSVTTTGSTSSNTIKWQAADSFGGQPPTDYRIYRGTTAGGQDFYYDVAASATTFTDKGDPATKGKPAAASVVGVPCTKKGDDGTPLVPGDTKFEPALIDALPLLDRVPIFNLLCVPGETDAATIQQVQQYCHDKRAFYIVDPPQTATITSLTTSGPANLNGQYAINSALYFPWIQAPDPLFGNRPTLFPPCGFIAGIYAATDAAIGVWKAPAGIDATLTGVSGLQYVLTDQENGNLNVQGINCLRQFRVYGNLVWGGRTLRGDDQIGSEWKYVPIRRLALYLESSLYNGTQWVVFEPNDERLWGQIRLNVGAFMQGLFLQGAFQGTTPRQAYFVKCDAENNPQSSIARGVVNILVGFAPLYPAEFVVIQIQQMAGQTQA
jgi:phage tail sheath protein FI